MSMVKHVFQRTGLLFSSYSKLTSTCNKLQQHQQCHLSQPAALAVSDEELNDFIGLPLTQLSEEEQMIQDSAARFCKEKIAPISRQMEETGKVPESIMKEIVELGWCGFRVPAKYGGVGGSVLGISLLIEEVARTDASFTTIFGYQNTLTNSILMRYGNEQQKQYYLPQIVKGELTSVCISESEAGSDAFAMRTQAVRDGDDFILNGTKMWITHASNAAFLLVMANAAPEMGYKGITCFAVDAGTPGVSIPRKEEKIGMKLAVCSPVIFENVRVPSSNIIGELGDGYKIIMNALTDGRIGIAAQGVGGAQGIMDYVVPYTLERRQFGKSLFDFQGMQHDMAKASIEIEAARLLTYNAARLHDLGRPAIKEASMAKHYATEICTKICTKGVKWLGAIGYMKSTPVEKQLRDLLVGPIYEGANNIQLNTIAASLKAQYR